MGKKIKKKNEIKAQPQNAMCKMTNVDDLTFEIVNSTLKTGELLSYKEICSRLNIEYCTGGEKKNQIEKLRRYFEIEKIKTKYLITDIYKEPKESDVRPPASNAIYIKYIETVLLQYLIRKEGYHTYITTTDLFNLLGMTNKEYKNYKYNYEPLIESDPVFTYFEVHNFYDRSYSFFTGIIDRGLESLRRRGYVTYYKGIFLISKKIEGSRDYVEIEATVSEIKEIMKVRHMVLRKFNLEDYSQVRYLSTRDQKKYYKQVDEILYKRFGWKKVYEVYHIIYTKEILIEAIERNQIELERLAMNEVIVNKINNQAEVKKEKSKDKVIEDYLYDRPLGFLYPDNYVEIQEKLSEKLLRLYED